MGIAERRRKIEEESPFERIPHYVLFPLVGALVGLGSPIGAFLLRFWIAQPVLKNLWIYSELNYNKLFYIYMCIGTVTAFVIFGYILGRRSERQRIHNKDLRSRIDELHLKSVTDGLTGAYSHAFLQEALSIELERARRRSHPLSVLLMDFDDFKLVNDTHGHLFGDRLLKEITETINMNIRQEDALGRYGGDEFLVIMPRTDAATAEHVAERIRSTVARTGVVDRRETSTDGARPVRMTLSIGIATFPDEEIHDVADLIHRADQNLYKAKKQGKNKTWVSAA